MIRGSGRSNQGLSGRVVCLSGLAAAAGGVGQDGPAGKPTSGLYVTGKERGAGGDREEEREGPKMRKERLTGESERRGG